MPHPKDKSMILYRVDDLLFLMMPTHCAAFVDHKSSTIDMWTHGYNVTGMTGWTQEYDKEWKEPLDIVREHWYRVVAGQDFPGTVGILHER